MLPQCARQRSTELIWTVGPTLKWIRFIAPPLGRRFVIIRSEAPHEIVPSPNRRTPTTQNSFADWIRKRSDEYCRVGASKLLRVRIWFSNQVSERPLFIRQCTGVA